jgi:hypothetical protein
VDEQFCLHEFVWGKEVLTEEKVKKEYSVEWGRVFLIRSRTQDQQSKDAGELKGACPKTG